MARNESAGERLVTAEEAIELAGVTPDIWAQAYPKRSRFPRPEPVGTRKTGPDNRNRRLVYRVSDVLEWAKARNAAVPDPANTHNAIVALVDGRRTERDIAELLDLHVRTVKRHLRGHCSCPLEQEGE